MADTNSRTDFVRFSLEQGVLRFGQFKVKSGRISPYFFNAGLFNSGSSVGRLAGFYAEALVKSGIEFDMLFGPAYKGIPLATATAVALAERGTEITRVEFRREVGHAGGGDRASG